MNQGFLRAKKGGAHCERREMPKAAGAIFLFENGEGGFLQGWRSEGGLVLELGGGGSAAGGRGEFFLSFCC